MAYTGKYKTPTELMGDEGLSREEKIGMLEQWSDDKEALMRAADEGMGGDFRADFLKNIEKALASLKEGSPEQD